jgi:NAD(P)-dependent dehydrogenase (short-subunit alcohol dehydrogenase family)
MSKPTEETSDRSPVALVTGGSAGLGRALTTALAGRGWRVVVDGRDEIRLREAASGFGPEVIAVPGDVADPHHREWLADAVRDLGRLDLLVNNASALGPSPLPALAEYPLAALREVHETNVVAPLGLIQLTLALVTASGGAIVNVSSDAAREPYPGWGGYGSAKAALDQLSAVLAAELGAGPRVYAFDPGDLRTEMHQRAFPGEDISDRPEPATVVPALLHLLDTRPDSGRYRAADLLAELARTPKTPAGRP